MKTQKNGVIVIAVIIILIAGVWFFLRNRSVPNTVPNPNPSVVTPQISGDTANLVSFSLSPGSKISGTVTISGSIKGGYFFEDQARGFLLDEHKDQKNYVLRAFSLTATSDWMTEGPVNFTGVINDIDTAAVMPGEQGYIRLENDNPSGDPARDKYIDIPVVFK